MARKPSNLGIFIDKDTGKSLGPIFPTPVITDIKRDDFKDFIFGASSASYQIEGGSAEGGRGFSIWDSYCLANPERIEDRSNGNIACDSYHEYKEDVKILKKTGFDAYRFSVSWPRILPGGKLCAGINREGINYYNDLINELLKEGIEPYVTLFHWDTPLALQDSYGGFLNEKIVDDFRDFAELCFWEFGDRVKNWVTINEAWTYTYRGYVNASFPPGRGSAEVPPTHLRGLTNEHPMIGYKNSWKAYPATDGNPGTEPYIVAHNIILAHATVVDLFREQFQDCQGGKIGMVNNINWYEALDLSSRNDQEAARRAVDFMFGWFVSPLVTGDYPQSMRKNVGDRLPTFTPEQTCLVRGSYDFLGVNYYTTYYAQNNTSCHPNKRSYDIDKQYTQFVKRGDDYIGKQAGSTWLYIVPEGLYEVLKFMAHEYGNPLVYITENGVDTLNEDKLPIRHTLNDQIRVDYHRDHLSEVHRAMTDFKANVKAYFIWSLFDNYEWTEGYTVRFGIFYIDFKDGRCSRYPKASAMWWRKFLKEDEDSIIWKRLPRKIKEIENVSKKRKPNDV